MEADEKSLSCTEVLWHHQMLMNLMEGLLAAQRINGSGQKVSRPQRNWTQIDGRPPSHKETGQKLKEGRPAAWKVHRKYPGGTKT